MVSQFVENYVSKLGMLLENIDSNVIDRVIETLDQAEKNKNIVYIVGNGGSAATASHMVNDLGVGLKRRNLKNLNIVSLADNTPVCTAIANDIGYDNVFYMQLKNCIRPDDIVIAISCSGNSPNIIKAVKYAKECHAKVIGLTGFDGGELKSLSDINFHVQTDKGEYGLVEDIHMIFDHLIYSYYLQKD